MLNQRQRRWADVVQMLHKCFMFAGSSVQSVVLWLTQKISPEVIQNKPHKTIFFNYKI